MLITDFSSAVRCAQLQVQPGKGLFSGFSRASICSSCTSDSLRRFVNYLPEVYFVDAQISIVSRLDSCLVQIANATVTYLKNGGKRIHTCNLLEPVRNIALSSPAT